MKSIALFFTFIIPSMIAYAQQIDNLNPAEIQHYLQIAQQKKLDQRH